MGKLPKRLRGCLLYVVSTAIVVLALIAVVVLVPARVLAGWVDSGKFREFHG